MGPSSSQREAAPRRLRVTGGMTPVSIKALQDLVYSAKRRQGMPVEKVERKPAVRSIKKSTTFSSLPFELVIEVLKFISWRDMLRVRRVCKLFLSASRERCFWEHYIHEHMLTKAYPPVLDRPKSMHTADELEHTFLLWKSAERGWTSGDGRSARERKLAVPSAIESVYIVPGGRWLLITSAMAEVYYVDLSAPTPSAPRLLIKAQFSMRGRKSIQTSVDLDLASPVLKFTVAFSLQEEYSAAGRPNPRRGRVQIWGVELVRGDHGDWLRASLLASVSYSNMVRHIQCISLHGSDFAFTTTTAGFTRNRANLYTIKWREPESKYWSLGLVMRNCKIQLLPESLILTLELFTFTLWSYEPAFAALHRADTQGPEGMLKIWEIDVYGVNIPRTLTVARTQKSCRLLLVIGESLCSLEFELELELDFKFNSCTSSEVPQLRMVLDTWPGMQFVNTQHMLGSAHEVIVSGLDERAISIRARGGSDSGTRVIALKRYCASRLYAPTAPPALDEHSGRIVVPQSNSVVLLDVALIYG